MSGVNKVELNESRRRFLRNAVLTGAAMATAPLIMPLPAQAGGLFKEPSPDDQKKIGEQASKEILKKYKEVFDRRALHFNSIGQRLVAALPEEDRRRWDFKFHVLDSKEINAFALPGGHMFMFTGLYEKVATDDALAAVTGHEMTHVRKQHWAKAYAEQQNRDLLVVGLLSILHAQKTVQSIAQLADSAVSLKYSRGEESDADAGGLSNMVAAGYNPEGMIQLFQTLQKAGGNGGIFGVDFLSDHPLTSERIKTARQTIDSMESRGKFPPLTPLNYNSLR